MAFMIYNGIKGLGRSGAEVGLRGKLLQRVSFFVIIMLVYISNTYSQDLIVIRAYPF